MLLGTIKMAKVLIIEDNDMLNQAYTFMLKAKGHDVDSAFDGEQGLKKAETFKPEVILLDYAEPHDAGSGINAQYPHTVTESVLQECQN